MLILATPSGGNQPACSRYCLGYVPTFLKLNKLKYKSISNGQIYSMKFTSLLSNLYQTSFFYLLLCFFFLFTHQAFARQGQPPNLFESIAALTPAELPPHALGGRGQLVRVQAQALRSHQLNLHLPDNLTLVANRIRHASKGDRGFTWVGNVDGEPGSLVVLTSHQGVIAGSISLGKVLFELTPVGSGQHALFQVNETALPPDGPHTNIDPTAIQENGGDTSAPGGTAPSTSQATAGYVIDLMVVYTPASRSRYGQAGIEAMITSAVESANQAYLNSAIDKQLNIVYMGEVSYSETGDMGNALTHLRSPSDGYMDEVHGLRNTYGADLVALVDEDANYCGIAYVMSSESTSFAPWAFSVTLSSCLSNHTLAHEIGHNDGTMHDRANSSSSGAYPYAYGFRRCMTDGTGFRTIMSYSCSGGTRISHFSNPNVFHNGFATGIDHDIDPANSADTARSMNNTADTVAAFRLTTTTSPTAPTNLSAVTTSYEQIDLSWSDTSSDETGIQVEQSLDNATWSVVASLSANSTSYSDTGLISSTTYYYRVRAYNGAGNSDYSNTDSSTTDALPPPPQAPGNPVAEVISGSQIDLSWSDTSGETGYRVERSLDNQTWSVIASINADSTTYSDISLQLATTYYYQIYAFNVGGDSLPSFATAATLAYTDYYAMSETLTAGSITGTYADTWFDDGVVETIAEVESGGKPSRRYSFLEHTWRFNIGSGSVITLHANTFGDTSIDGDAFLFQYAINGGAFVDAFELTGTNLTGWETWLLPSPAGGGTVDIRVIDTDRTTGHRASDAISVDELFIRVESDPDGTPPTAPSDLSATAPAANEATLSWRDNGNDEYGFQIERSQDGVTWGLIADVEANSVLHHDVDVAPNTTYHYRVSAYNGAGMSAPSNTAQVTTLVGANITLSGSAYKVKGIQHVDLTWSGVSSPDVDIYRDGSLLTSPSNVGAYTDNIGQKGGGIYTYQVCEAGSTICSDVLEVLF
jgi:hypothetical protein